jgi:hypothetical protein
MLCLDCIDEWLSPTQNQVEETSDNSSTTQAHAKFKRATYHASIEVIFRDLENVCKEGFVVECWDGVSRRIFPYLSDLVADYEEQ